MELVHFLGWGLMYVLLQLVALTCLPVAWRRFAAVSVVMVCGIIVTAVAAGLLGVPGTEVVTFLAVPIGIAAQLGMFTAFIFWRFARTLPEG